MKSNAPVPAGRSTGSPTMPPPPAPPPRGAGEGGRCTARTAGLLAGLVCLLAVLPLRAQEPPRLQAVFPPGGQVGQTVEVMLTGVPGARELVFFGEGLSGEVDRAEGADDPEAKQVFESKCANCHELRSPDNRSLAPAAWEATVRRMIDVRGADINDADRERIVAFLKARAAAANVVARITIAPDTPPGRHELRAVNSAGVSTAYPFYVSDTPEAVEVEPNNQPDQAQPVALPAVVNGVCLANGDRDYYRLEAKKDQRLTFRAEAYGLNHDTQNSFDACLFVYDSTGKRLASNLGFDNLDPLIDFTVPADGSYTVEVRDLLYRGGAGSVYRLSLGELGYHQAIYPLGGRRGEEVETFIYSENQPEQTWRQRLSDKLLPGIRRLATPFGIFPFHISDLPEVYDAAEGLPQEIAPPCIVNGWIGEPGERDGYVIDVTPQMVTTLAEWAVVGPFAVPGPEALDTPLPPEQQYLAGQLSPEATYPGGEQPLRWEMKQASGDGVIGLPAGENQAWFAVRQWDLAAEASGLLALGTDDDAKVWVNGELAHVFRGGRAAIVASDLVPLKLRRGSNTIFVKIINRSGPAGLAAAAGAWSFEVFAERLGSPLKPKISLWFDNAMKKEAVDGPGGDPWIDHAYTQPGKWGLKIEDELNEGSPRHAYRLRIGPTRPAVSLRAFPSNLSIGRGGVAPLYVERNSMNGYRGDITLRVEGLPDGMWADEVIMPADKPRVVIPVECYRDAKPAVSVLRVVGEVPSIDGTVEQVAEAVAFYRIQNDRFPIEQQALAAAVVDADAPYTVDVEPKRLSVRIGQQAQLKVTVTRREGFGGDLTLIAVSLPDGVQATTPTLGGGRNEATIDLTFTEGLRNTPFGASLQPDVYQFAVAAIAGGDGLSGGISLCSAPIVLEPGSGAEPPPQPGDRGRALLEQRCTTCHQLYDPMIIRKTPDEWTATVDRMIGKGARVNADERTALLEYLHRIARMQ